MMSICQQNCDERPCLYCRTCMICGFKGHGGLGYWAVGLPAGVYVCRGKCWAEWQAGQDVAADVQEAFDP